MNIAKKKTSSVFDFRRKHSYLQGQDLYSSEKPHYVYHIISP